MTIEKTMDGSTAVLRLEGWLDTQNAPVLAEALNGLDDGAEKLVLDLEKLEYISSAGIRQIVTAYKEMNGELTLKNLSTEVASVLHMTGLDKKLTIES